ncbi:MAG: transposase [archaeon]
MTIIKKYTEDFKSRIIREIEEGKYHSLSEAARLNGMTKYETIRKWIIQKGRQELLPKVLYVN